MDGYLNSLELTELQVEVLVGLMLGDAHMELRSGHVRIKFEQSERHLEYLMHLYEVFKNIVLAEPKSKVSWRFGRPSKKWYFQSRVVPGLARLYELFYRDKRKVVDSSIANWLTSVGLAYWFMDDGSIKSRESKGVIFNTQGFASGEVDILCQVLTVKFDLIVSKRPQKVGYQIYVSGKSYEKFLSLVERHVVESMRYKLPPARAVKTRKTYCPKSTGGAQW